MLENIRVVECAAFLVGPRIAAHLADLGADVIKIEHPQGGEPMRNVRHRGSLPRIKDVNFTLELENRGKKSITLDLNTERGQEVAYRLIEGADVFVSNFQAQVLKRLKMDYETLSRINPRIIYAMVSGWGKGGPEKDRPGFDYSVFAESGLMASLGEPGTPPVPCRPGLGDHITAMVTSYGIMAALYHRERTGEGQMVHASILGSLIDAGALTLQAHLSPGEETGRVSRKSATNALWSFYETKDGHHIQFAMVQSDRFWPEFCAALDMGEHQNDPRFTDSYAREDNAVALIEIIDRIMASRTRDEWLEHFRGTDIICAPVMSYSELARKPQVKENNYVIEVDHATWGRIPMVGIPVDFSRTPGQVRGGAPELGQHTEEVLLELGYTWEDIGKLKDERVIL